MTVASGRAGLSASVSSWDETVEVGQTRNSAIPNRADNRNDSRITSGKHDEEITTIKSTTGQY